MLETYSLKYFVELAKFKTLQETSKNLHLTQSTLSRFMQKLENVIGVTLFIRKKFHCLE